MSTGDQMFRVLYTKRSDKKRKTYSDGKLRIASACLTLIDDDGKSIFQKKGYLDAITVGVDVMLGGFEVQIEEAVDMLSIDYVHHTSTSNACVPPVQDKFITKKAKTDSTTIAMQKPSSSIQSTTSIPASFRNKFVCKKFVSGGSLPSYKPTTTTTASTNGLTISSAGLVLNNEVNTYGNSNSSNSSSNDNSNGNITINNSTSSNNSNNNCSISSNNNNTNNNNLTNSNHNNNLSTSMGNTNGALSFTTTKQPDIMLDTALVRVMRPHQIEAANFLISRLLGGENRENPDNMRAKTTKVTDTTATTLTINDIQESKVKGLREPFLLEGALSESDGSLDSDNNSEKNKQKKGQKKDQKKSLEKELGMKGDLSDSDTLLDSDDENDYKKDPKSDSKSDPKKSPKNPKKKHKKDIIDSLSDSEDLFDSDDDESDSFDIVNYRKKDPKIDQKKDKKIDQKKDQKRDKEKNERKKLKKSLKNDDQSNKNNSDDDDASSDDCFVEKPPPLVPKYSLKVTKYSPSSLIRKPKIYMGAILADEVRIGFKLRVRARVRIRARIMVRVMVCVRVTMS
jgi:hypothetical protein